MTKLVLPILLLASIAVYSVVVDANEKDKPDVGTVIGIDLGMYRSFV